MCHNYSLETSNEDSAIASGIVLVFRCCFHSAIDLPSILWGAAAWWMSVPALIDWDVSGATLSCLFRVVVLWCVLVSSTVSSSLSDFVLMFGVILEEDYPRWRPLAARVLLSCVSCDMGVPGWRHVW